MCGYTTINVMSKNSIKSKDIIANIRLKVLQSSCLHKVPFRFSDLNDIPEISPQ